MAPVLSEAQNGAYNAANGAADDSFEPVQQEPIAVIGFSFKYPQEATTVESFWKMLVDGRCASTDIPADRMNVDGWYHPDPYRHDSINFRGGHYLKEDIGAFDAPFFAINPVEAAEMDPHQRGLLETSYQALENAGIRIEEVTGSATSVYSASFADDYKICLYRDPERVPTYMIQGISSSFLANRISWFYDLKGPSLNVDSACSSSLVAVDHACQDLRNGQSKMSLVAGGNIVLDPGILIAHANLNVLSADSRCYSFDSRANGYATGEGMSVLVLKRLSDAIADGNCIRAVIRSTGTNSDGRTPGISQPSSVAQENLIRATYQKAGLNMKLTRFFEAHATGTSVGDPLEAAAIGNAFAKQRSEAEPMIVGALKSNIGHLEGGAGLAGLIKTILVLEKGVIPPNSNFEKLNPKIDAASMHLTFPLKPTPWPSKGLRRASVNCFGFGGTNSHVVVEDAYNHLRLRSLDGIHSTKVLDILTTKKNNITTDNTTTNNNTTNTTTPNSTTHKDIATNGSDTNGVVTNGTPTNGHATNGSVTNGTAANGIDANGTATNGTTTNGIHTNGTATNGNITNGDGSRTNGVYKPTTPLPKLLLWSSADQEGVIRLLRTYTSYFTSNPPTSDSDENLENLAYTLSNHRSSLLWKSHTIVKSTADLQDLEKLTAPAVKQLSDPNIAFVFTGQGAQWAKMGVELLAFPTFRTSLEEAETYVRGLGSEWSLIEELEKSGPESRINRAALSQPLCTALQVAMVDLLTEVGVRPVAVVGHSSGEIAAGYCSGALSRESAWKVAYYRGLLAESFTDSDQPRGAMMAVGISEDDIHPFLNSIKIRFENCEVYIACINSPQSITLSGDEKQIDALGSILDEANIFNRKLKVDVPYHSSRMTTIASEYQRLLGKLEPGEKSENSPRMLSSLRGRQVAQEEVNESQYWIDNLTSPVRFSEAVALLYHKSGKEAGVGNILPDTLLEIGPHSALQGPVKDTLKELPSKPSMEYISCLLRQKPSIDTFITSLGKLACRGHTVDLSKINSSGKQVRMLTDLPAYPFNHSQSYMFDGIIDKGYRLRSTPRHDLLGTQAPDFNPIDGRWRHVIKVNEVPWVKDHVVNGVAIYPATGMIVMAIEASKQTADKDKTIAGFKIRDLEIKTSLVVPDDSKGVETMFSLRRLKDRPSKASSWSEFILSYFNAGSWTESSRGKIRILYGDGPGADRVQFDQDFAKATESCKSAVDTKTFYNHLKQCGIDYGPTFQSLQWPLYDENSNAISDVGLFQDNDGMKFNSHYTVHPASLDAIFHLHYAGVSAGGTKSIPTMVPTRIRKLWISNSGLSSHETSAVQVISKTKNHSPRAADSAVYARSCDTKEPKILAEGIEVIAVADVVESTQSVLRPQRYHRMIWKPDVAIMSPKELAQAVGDCIADPPDDREYFDNLTLVLLMFTNEIVNKLDSFDMSKLEKHELKYLEWCKLKVAEFKAGKLSGQRSGWEDVLEDAALRDSLCDSVAAFSSQGKLFVEVGKRVQEILHKNLSIHEVLFGGSLANDFYQDFFKAEANLGHCFTKYIDALAHKNPNMRILEIGAGTGGATEFLLNILSNDENGKRSAPRYSQYDFTDISPSFFEKARERFHEHEGRIKFKMFDVEVDPLKQNLEPSYDLIVAFASMHITKDLALTIQNVRKLLQPGGKLIMCDPMRPDLLRSGFVFGLLNGWWLSEESFREWGPLCEEDRWNELLLDNGYSGNDLVIHDYLDKACGESNIIVTTAVAPSKPKISVPKTTIIVDESSDKDNNVASLLHQFILEMGGEDVEIASLSAIAARDNIKDRFYISLLEYTNPFLYNLDEANFNTLKSFMLSAKTVLWVTGGAVHNPASPNFGAIEGFFRVLRNEDIGASLVSLSLEPSPDATERQLRNISVVLEEMLKPSDSLGRTVEWAERDGVLSVNRLEEIDSVKQDILQQVEPKQVLEQEIGSAPPLQLDIARPGFLDTLHFIEDPTVLDELHPDEVEIKVKAVGISVCDTLFAMGRSKRKILGDECSGTVIRAGATSGLNVGDNVACCGTNLFRTNARSKSAVVIPPSLKFEEAASVPLSFSAAYHSLVDVARARPGEKILIHNGGCGVGQACIQMAQYLELDIIVTVPKIEEKNMLLKNYSVPAERILLNKDESFANDVLRISEGGVNILLNSLDEDGTAASWECVAPFGQFIEVGPDFKSNERRLNLPELSNLSYHTTDLFVWAEQHPKLAQKALVKVMELFSEGKLRPTSPVNVYPSSQVAESLRNFFDLGKTVVTISDEDVVKMTLDRKPAYDFDENATYVVSGGLGTCGKAISQWMVSKGAKHLLLLSRSGAQSAPEFIASLEAQGAQVSAPRCDVSNIESLSSVIAQTEATMPPIKGCIQAAVVVDNIIFAKMSYAEWIHVSGAKIQGSWNLHTALPRNLDFFILLSSMSGCIGFHSQAHYGAGNTYQDRLARFRIASGERATSLNLGPIDLDGPNYRAATFRDLVFNSGIHLIQSDTDLCALIEYVSGQEQKKPRTQEMAQIVMGIEDPAVIRSNGREEPDWMHRALFSHFYTRGSGDLSAKDKEEAQKDKKNTSTLLAAAATDADAVAIVTKALIQKLSSVLSLPADSFDTQKPMHAYGIDSLVAIELRNWFSKELSADVAVFDIMGEASLAAIGELVSKRSSWRKGASTGKGA